MAIGALLVKIAVPLALAGGGVAAYVTTPDNSSGPSSQSNALWIDSPFDGSTVPVGDVAVVAHSTAVAQLTSMTLTVDGEVVATSTDLDVFDKLVNTSFLWAATAGVHVLQVSGGQEVSDPVVVSVGEAPLGIPEQNSTTTTVDATTTTVESTTTTVVVETTAPTSTLPAPTQPAPTLPPPTTTPPPPPTAPPAPPPTLTNVSFNPVLNPPCDATITITGTVANATGGQGTVSAGTSGASLQGDQLVATVSLAAAGISNKTGSFPVSLTATGPGGSVTVQAGLVTVLCGPKD